VIDAELYQRRFAIDDGVLVAERDAASTGGDGRHAANNVTIVVTGTWTVIEGLVAPHDLRLERSRGANDVQAVTGGGRLEWRESTDEGLTTNNA